MPRRGYVPTNRQPNLIDHGYERVAAILHSRLSRQEGRFYCLVLSTGRTYLRATREKRQGPINPQTWIGTYTAQTPVELIEDDLLERLREITSQRNAA